MLGGKIFKDYALLNAKTPEGVQKIFGAIDYFMKAPKEVQQKLLDACTTQYSVTSDFSTEVRALIDRLHLGLEEIDVGYANLFDVRDFSGTPVPGFRIREVSTGLSFTKRPEGGRVRIYRITGTEAYVTFDTYGGGLEFDQAWFDDQEWWQIEDSALEFRSAWYRDKATAMYTLVGAIGAGQNVAYDATGANQLEKDIITINTACARLIAALIALGYPVTANTRMVILSPIQLKARLNRALAAVNVPVISAAAQIKVEYNIQPVFTTNLINAGAACTDKWYLGVPGIKNKIGEKMPLSVYSEFNIRGFAQTAVGWGRYGAYLNESQVLRLATA